MTRSDYSEIHGQYIVTLSFAERRYHRWLDGPKQARTVAEGVMQEYEREYPGLLPDIVTRAP